MQRSPRVKGQELKDLMARVSSFALDMDMCERIIDRVRPHRLRYKNEGAYAVCVESSRTRVLKFVNSRADMFTAMWLFKNRKHPIIKFLFADIFDVFHVEKHIFCYTQDMCVPLESRIPCCVFGRPFDDYYKERISETELHTRFTKMNKLMMQLGIKVSDIGSRNIMMTRDGRVVITDIGCSTLNEHVRTKGVSLPSLRNGTVELRTLKVRYDGNDDCVLLVGRNKMKWDGTLSPC